MYSKRDMYVEINSPTSNIEKIALIGTNRFMGDYDNALVLETQWKNNDGKAQSLRERFNDPADALYFAVHYREMLAKAANEELTPFRAEIIGLNADGFLDWSVKYVITENTNNALPWCVRAWEDDKPYKAFANFYTLEDAFNYAMERNNYRVSSLLATAVSEKGDYALEAVDSQDADIAAKGIMLSEDFSNRDADGYYVKYPRIVDSVPELTSYNPTERANYLQNLIANTEWDITNAEYEFRDDELTVWLHVDVVSSKSGETERLNAHFSLDDPLCNRIFFEPLGYSVEEYDSFDAIEDILPEIQDKLLHSSAVFEYLKNEVLNNPVIACTNDTKMITVDKLSAPINTTSMKVLLDANPSRKFYPDGVIPEKELAQAQKHTTDIDR